MDELTFLEEAIQSALDQDLDEFEILLVCNGDTLLMGHQQNPLFRHPALRWVHEPRRGSAFARNKGLSEATGMWLQFLDVDDLIKKNKITGQLHFQNGDVIVSPITYKFLNGKAEPGTWGPDDIWSGLLGSELGSTSSMLWRRDAIQNAGGWNPDYYSNQEYELIFRMLRTGYHVEACPENLTIVRERISGSITKNTAHRPKAGIQLRENIWSYLVQNNLDTPARFRAFQKFVFKNLRALYISNRQEALALHQQYFSGTGYLPRFKSIPFYHLIYKTLGFDQTEKLMHYYRQIRQRYITSLPSNN